MRVAACLFVLAACSDVDLTGVYQVESSVGSMPCGTDAPLSTPPAYVKMAKGEFFSAEYFALLECTDAAGTDCTGGSLFGGDTFSEPIDNGWQGVLASSFSGGDSDPTCTLVYTKATATLSGTKLTVESTTYTEDVDNNTRLCQSDEAERRNDSMMCSEHTLLQATRI